MFDYPTHKDFGSGDRVCYHGVMDTFRNPKLAAALYASQGDKTPVLEIGSPMDIGDYPAGNIGDIWAFTNAEEVALYKNDRFVASFRTKGWDGLPHGPVAIDDTIGELLETQEHFPHDKAELLRKCLVSAGKNGLAGMPVADKARMAWAMARYKLTMDDGVALFGKYVGNWGGAATRWRFDARTGGKTVASVTRASGAALHMEVRVSKTALCEGDTWDAAAVRVRILDEHGTPASYAQLPVRFSLTGAAHRARHRDCRGRHDRYLCAHHGRERGGRSPHFRRRFAGGRGALLDTRTKRRTGVKNMELLWRVELENGATVTGSTLMQPGENRIVCDLPDDTLKSVTGAMLWDTEPGERIFINGFQSWTYSPECGVKDRTPSFASPLARFKPLGLERYGDYYFTDYPETPGVTHGESYAYWRRGEHFRLLGSLDEAATP